MSINGDIVWSCWNQRLSEPGKNSSGNSALSTHFLRNFPKIIVKFGIPLESTSFLLGNRRNLLENTWILPGIPNTRIFPVRNLTSPSNFHDFLQFTRLLTAVSCDTSVFRYCRITLVHIVQKTPSTQQIPQKPARRVLEQKPTQHGRLYSSRTGDSTQPLAKTTSRSFVAFVFSRSIRITIISVWFGFCDSNVVARTALDTVWRWRRRLSGGRCREHPRLAHFTTASLPHSVSCRHIRTFVLCHPWTPLRGYLNSPKHIFARTFSVSRLRLAIHVFHWDKTDLNPCPIAEILTRIQGTGGQRTRSLLPLVSCKLQFQR